MLLQKCVEVSKKGLLSLTKLKEEQHHVHLLQTSVLAISNAPSDQVRRDKPAGSLPPSKIWTCVISYLCSTISSLCDSFMLCSLPRDFPRVVLRPPVAMSCRVTGKKQTPRPLPYTYRIRVSEGIALESVLLKTRCSASVNGKYILVRNKLLFQLFLTIGLFKIMKAMEPWEG